MFHRHHERGHRFGRHHMAEHLASHMAERFGWNREGGPRGGRGGGRRRMFDSGELKLVLLKLIWEQPRHGYDLIKDIEAKSGGVYAPSAGVIYPTLTLLADMGHVEEQADGSRKRFAITAEGSQFLADNADAVTAAFDRLDSLAKESARTDSAPVRRAMHNLHAVLHARLSQDGADKAIQLEVAAILDEAAGRIERL